MDMYLFVKALHIISLAAWVSGMTLLPLLFARHATLPLGSDNELLLQEMERKLLRRMVNPAMILVFVFGVTLVAFNMDWLKQGWLHGKLLLVFLLSGLHGFLSASRKRFAAGENRRSAAFYRRLSVVTGLGFVLAILLAVTKPF